MKKPFKSSLYSICNLCIALAGILHWGKMSFLFFGEQKYPEENK